MSQPKITTEQLKAELSAGMTPTQIAKKYDVNVRRIHERKARLAKSGFSPEHDMVHMVPDGFQVRGVSTLYDKDGIKSAQWVKSSIDAQRQFELMQEAVKAMETNLMVVEQHRTLAAKDAYASRGGWMSGRDAKVITYHKEHGKVSELTISPSMVA